jgi:sporulation protein YlmC with PRC-barrel domain
MTQKRNKNKPFKPGAEHDGQMEISSLVGREVYTNNGVFVGEVSDIKLDFETQQVDRLALEYVNTDLLKLPRRKSGVLVPFRWVQSVGDVILTAEFVEALDIQKLAKD